MYPCLWLKSISYSCSFSLFVAGRIYIMLIDKFYKSIDPPHIIC